MIEIPIAKDSPINVKYRLFLQNLKIYKIVEIVVIKIKGTNPPERKEIPRPEPINTLDLKGLR